MASVGCVTGVGVDDSSFGWPVVVGIVLLTLRAKTENCFPIEYIDGNLLLVLAGRQALSCGFCGAS